MAPIKFIFRFWRDTRGQDLLEYALIVGLVVLATGAIMPGAAQNIAHVHSKLASQAARVAAF